MNEIQNPNSKDIYSKQRGERRGKRRDGDCDGPFFRGFRPDQYDSLDMISCCRNAAQN